MELNTSSSVYSSQGALLSLWKHCNIFGGSGGTFPALEDKTQMKSSRLSRFETRVWPGSDFTQKVKRITPKPDYEQQFNTEVVFSPRNRKKQNQIPLKLTKLLTGET